MKPPEYDCLGCNYYFSAAGMNFLYKVFPETGEVQELNHALEEVGEYNCGLLLPENITRFAMVQDVLLPFQRLNLAERLALIRPTWLCIVGKTETENIGIGIITPPKLSI